jgi:hypothetical protein
MDQIGWKRCSPANTVGAARTLRNGTLAHALGESDGNVAIGDIRDFMNVTSELAQHTELIFMDAAPNWSSAWRIRLKEANEFWDCCQKGF